MPPEQGSKLQSTPWNARSASHESYETQDEYSSTTSQSTLQVTIPFDELLFIVFHLSSDWRNKYTEFSTIASSPHFQKLLHDYAREVTHETDRYHSFNNLANHAIEELAKHFSSKAAEPIILCRNDVVPIIGSSAQRIPDCVVIPLSAMGRGVRGSYDNPFSWVELLAFFKFKLEELVLSITVSTASNFTSAATAHQQATSKKSTSSRNRSQQDLEVPSKKRQRLGGDPLMDSDTKTQCASYALKMMSHSGLRTHVFGALITDGKLELLYYDRSQPVMSTPICFLQDPSSLVAFLYCMQQSTSSQWGYSDVLKLKHFSSPDAPLTDPLHGACLTLNNGVDLELGNLVFFQRALIGRGTCVVHASVIGSGPKEWEGKSLVIKFSFTPTTRPAEGNTLAKIIKHANSDISHKWVLNHLPEVLHYQAFPPRATQSRLSAYLQGKGMEYEERELQVLVMTELFPITKLTTTDVLVPAIRGVFKCYRWLYEEVNLMHRDISLNNIMYRQKAGEPVCGVLSDYDLALFLTSQDHGANSKQRTGTMPYMARDLLEPDPPKHLYRHDLESLFYVIVVLTSRYHNGQEVKGCPPPLQAWFDLGMEGLKNKKSTFLLSPIPQPTANFQEMRKLTVKMRVMFRNGIFARADHGDLINGDLINQAIPEFDESTLGGRVDFDKFGQILDMPI